MSSRCCNYWGKRVRAGERERETEREKERDKESERYREKEGPYAPSLSPVLVAVGLSDLLTVPGCTVSRAAEGWETGGKKRDRDGRWKEGNMMERGLGSVSKGLIDNDIPARLSVSPTAHTA